jgi:hypothetical protein
VIRRANIRPRVLETILILFLHIFIPIVQPTFLTALVHWRKDKESWG